MNKNIYIYHIEEKVTTLGPGNRFGIWFQGCKHGCKGCIVPDSHPTDKNGKWYTVNEIIELIKKQNDLRGVTISGGEPFLQLEGLLKLVLEIKKLKLDIICFTGFKYEYLFKNKISKKILENIDILVDGKYVEKLNENNYLRGSSNQRIIHLKKTYLNYEKFMNNLKNRNVEVFMTSEGKVFIAGIPPKDDTLDEDLQEIMQ